MIPLLVVAAAALAWALTHRRLKSLAVTGPMLMVAVGLVVGWVAGRDADGFFDSSGALQTTEIILALLLFINATQLRGPLRAQLSGPAIRLLAIALPLTLILITAAGVLLPMELSVGVVLIIACIAAPADYSKDFVHARGGRVPGRVSRWLSIEGGYNDGLLSPVLLVAITLAAPRSGETTHDVAGILLGAIPAILIAIAVGLGAGALCGVLLKVAYERRWADVQSTRIGVFALPLLAYALATTVHGNGFIAAFICGIAYRLAQGRHGLPSDTHLVEDMGSFLNLLLWLGFGAAAAVLFSHSFDWWPAIALALIAVTVGRAAPVLLALIGSRTTWPDRIYMAAVGPKGPASIVFALIAFSMLPREQGFPILAATAVVMLSSLLLHGIGGPLLTRRLYPTKRALAR